MDKFNQKATREQFPGRKWLGNIDLEQTDKTILDRAILSETGVTTRNIQSAVRIGGMAHVVVIIVELFVVSSAPGQHTKVVRIMKVLLTFQSTTGTIFCYHAASWSISFSGEHVSSGYWQVSTN